MPQFPAFPNLPNRKRPYSSGNRYGILPFAISLIDLAERALPARWFVDQTDLLGEIHAA